MKLWLGEKTKVPNWDPSSLPRWAPAFGQLRYLHEETKRIEEIIEAEFEQVAEDEWETPITRVPPLTVRSASTTIASAAEFQAGYGTALHQMSPPSDNVATPAKSQQPTAKSQPPTPAPGCTINQTESRIFI